MDLNTEFLCLLSSILVYYQFEGVVPDNIADVSAKEYLPELTDLWFDKGLCGFEMVLGG